MINSDELKQAVEDGLKRGWLLPVNEWQPPVKQPVDELLCPICQQPIRRGVKHAAFAQPERKRCPQEDQSLAVRNII